MKVCTRCEIRKKNCAFSKRSRSSTGLQAWCRACQREDKLQSRYGISSEDYQALYDKQWGVCALCERGEHEMNRELCIDHCHDTNRIRGLLCFDCNTSLGKLGDNVEGLTKALEYLIIAEAQKPSDGIR